MALVDLRKEYSLRGFTEQEALADPFAQFRVWLDDALSRPVLEPNAMTLATCGPDGKPSARVVLLRGFDERGFTFFTNRRSRKGRDLAANPWASLVLFWVELERQVRIDGKTEWTSDTESDEYFQSRPRGSQLAALASSQSEALPDRATLDTRFEELKAAYEGKPVPRPAHWGGYRLVPSAFEFWQGRPSRLHDRLRYEKSAKGAWLRERLAP